MNHHKSKGGDRLQLEDFLNRLDGVKRCGNGYSAKCPAHDDKNASLTVSQGKDGKILVCCQAGCSTEAVIREVGLSMKDLFSDGGKLWQKTPRFQKSPQNDRGKLVARYDYYNAQGKLIAQKTRWERWENGKRKKTFTWSHPDGNGGWKSGRNGATILYRLSELLQADTVFLCEGEKDVDNLQAQGLMATCTPDGAGTGNKWKDSYTPYFAGKTVYILQDNDDVGKNFAQYQAQKLAHVTGELKILDPVGLWPDLPEHGDISDVLEHMGTVEGCAALLELANKTPKWDFTQPQKDLDSPSDWFDGKKVNEVAFCDAFRQKYGEMVCINGVFYNKDGMVERDKLLHCITMELTPYVSTRLAQKAKDLLSALRSFCYQEESPPDPSRIHVKGGYVELNGTFHPDEGITRNRLSVEYDPAANPPRVFLDYVNALLEPEDVRTLQEFLGYCCIPTTKAQKMLFLIGSGGEGKSVLSQVLKNIFGTSMTSGSLHDLERNRFTLANLEGKLLFLDEDMGVSAAKESQVQKRLVTANAPMSIERKGEQAVQVLLTCRLLAFGNVPFSSLYDHSEGAFRRRIILTTNPKAKGRKDDKDLPLKILEGKSGVFNWMLEGLQRLISNNWEFTISPKAMQNLEESKKDSFNLLGFLGDETAVRLGDLSRKITGVALYDSYTAWCHANGEKPLTRNSVSSYLKQEQKRLGIQSSNHVPDNQGGKVRGFAGIEIIDRRYVIRSSIHESIPLFSCEVSQIASKCPTSVPHD